MPKKHARLLSLCLSIAVTASAVPANCASSVIEISKNISGSDDKQTIISQPDTELFSQLTLNAGSTELIADGKNVGNSFGGFTVSDDHSIFVDINGENVPVEQAESIIGCNVLSDGDGNLTIVSPFRSSAVIVKSENDFDDCGAETSEKCGSHYRLRYKSPSEAYQAYQKLCMDENIEYAEPDIVCRTMENTDNSNDIEHIDSWGRDVIGSDEFCKRLKNEKDELPEVKVAVIDTGINYEHNQFKGRILDGGKCFLQGSIISKPDDDDGHGTHCAGIICSSTNENVKILPIKVFDANGGGYVFDIYQAMMYAIEQKADIISMSLGGSGMTSLFDEAVEAAKENDIIVCVAAGNDNMNSGEGYEMLASNDDCVVISSVDSKLDISDFSNYGKIDFAAPGEYILSAGIDSEDDIEEMSGTSMATPFASACFADVLSYDIDLTSDEVYDYMKANTIDIGNPGYDEQTGWGLVNLRNFNFTTERIFAPIVKKDNAFPTKELNIFFHCNTPGTEIYYTLDGSAPSPENGIKYDGKDVVIDKPVHLRAAAVLNGKTGDEYSKYILIDETNSLNTIEVKNGILTEYKGNIKKLDITQYIEDGLLPEIHTIGTSAFSGSIIDEVILPDSVTEICSSAFKKSKVKKVVSNAEIVRESAFEHSDIESFIDDNLRSVRNYSFSGCSSLTEINARNLTEIPFFAFDSCYSLTSDSFDFPKITKIDSFGLNCCNLTGKIDISNAEIIGESALSSNEMEEVVFSDKITGLPDSILSNCSKIKRISAPSVTKIGDYSLSLCKHSFDNDYTENDAVECDIDFSKVTDVGDHAFGGYIFDKPVSFDLLSDCSVLIAFQRAYGESVSFPSITALTSVCDGASINLLNLYLENVEYTESGSITSCNTIVFSDKLKKYEQDTILKSGLVITPSENSDIRKNAESGNVHYGTFPSIFSEKYEYTFPKNSDNGIIVSGGGTQYKGAWFRRYSNGKEMLIPDATEKAPFIPDSSEAGTTIYIYRLYDSNNKTAAEKKFTVTIASDDYPEKEIKADVYENVVFDDSKFDKDHLTHVLYKFIPEKTDTYNICNNFEFISLISDGNETSIGNSALETLEAGKEYIIRIDTQLQFIPDDGYLVIKSPDYNEKNITSIIPFINTGNYDYSENYVPYVQMTDRNGDKEYTLVKDVDFTVENEAPVKFGMNTCIIKGIGEYTGVRKYEYCLPIKAKLDEEVLFIYDATNADGEAFSFTAPESGMYKIVSMPDKKDIENAAENNLFPKDWETFLLLTQNGRWITYVNSVGGENILYSRQKNISNVYMEKGATYNLKNFMYGRRYIFTRGDTLADCDFSYDLNYEYNGSPVKPIITITGKNGETLTEGKDYTLTYWGNDKPGNMFAYIEGTGKYVGCKNIAMTVTGADIAAEDDIMSQVLIVKQNKEFRYFTDMTYKITIDKTTAVKMYTTNNYSLPPTNFLECETKNYVGSIDSTSERLVLEKGTYYFWAYSLSNIEVPQGISTVICEADDAFPICSAEINVPETIYTGEAVEPEISLVYNGKTLVRDTDYEIIFPESVKSGWYTAKIKGKGLFVGSMNVDYCIKTDKTGEIRTLSEGTNTISPENNKNAMYKWTPEKELYYFTSTSYQNTRIVISDENGKTLFDDICTSKTPLEVEIVPDKTYEVYLTDSNTSNYDMILKTSGNIEKCKAEYTERIAYTGREFTPDAVFRDGDHTLIEGTDYKLSNNGYVDGIGVMEFTYEGIGNYFGRTTVNVTVYSSEVPQNETVLELTPNLFYHLGLDSDMSTSYFVVGDKKYFKVTSDYESSQNYHLGTYDLNYDPVNSVTIIGYDENMQFTGINDEVRDFTLEKGETRYFAVVTPYYYSTDDQVNSSEPFIMLRKANDEPQQSSDSIPGDVDCSGKVDNSDVILLNNFLAGNAELTPQGMINADVTAPVEKAEDADLTAADADYIILSIAGKCTLTDKGIVYTEN